MRDNMKPTVRKKEFDDILGILVTMVTNPQSWILK